MNPPLTLRRLARLRLRYDAETPRRRMELLQLLDIQTLESAKQVHELHEILLFHYAYPDGREIFRQVELMLGRFSSRRDLVRYREELIDTGIAGTDIYYAFCAPTARWLALRWGANLEVDWEMTGAEKVDRYLHLLALYAESPGQNETPLPGRAWLDRLRGDTTDAEFIIRRMAALPVVPVLSDEPFLRDLLYDELELMIRLAPGPGTPSRSRARFSGSPFTAQSGPLRRGRPDMKIAARTPPLRIRNVTGKKARELIDLAREAMVTRSRDLDAFADADAKDVRIIDCGEGLEFACLGVVPEKRLLLEAVYGYLILRNGVLIGYALTSALWRSSELAYNLFETYRGGGEAAHIYGCLLGIIRAMFNVDTFTVYPYQLGHENEEGIRSGAWWFYYKLGFRPRDGETLELVDRELGRMRRRKTYRSSPESLRKLAAKNVFLDLEKPRNDVIGIIELDRIGLAVTDHVTARFGRDRERASTVFADETASILGAGDWKRFPAAERLAWQRWSPLVSALPDVERWPKADRLSLGAILRAKGGRRESDFVALFDSHRRFQRSLYLLSRRTRKKK